MGSPYFATTATHHPSPPPSKAATRIYLGNGPRAYTRTTNAWRDYPPASPHRLPTTGSGPTLPPPPTPERVVRQGSDGQHHRPRHGRTITGTGISTRPPSTTPDGLALGPGSPWAEQPGPGTLGHSAAEILTLHSLLMPAFSLPHPPRLPHRAASPDAGRSPTQHHHPERWTDVAAASAVCLSPATLSAQDHLTSELLRTLSRVAASKPTSWLSRRSHILSHLAHT